VPGGHASAGEREEHGISPDARLRRGFDFSLASLSLSLSLAYAIDLIDSDVSHIYPSIYLFISRGIRSAATWLFIIAVSGHLSRNGFISETETRGLDLARSRAIDKRYTNR